MLRRFKKKCENEEDVATQFQLGDVKTVKTLPLHSLVNRLKSFAYRLGFYDGYLKRKMTERKHIDDEKPQKRDKNIRVLKTMALMLSRIIGNNEVGKNKERAITTEVEKSLLTKEEVDSAVVKTVFSAGDFRKAPILKKVVYEIENKEGR